MGSFLAVDGCLSTQLGGPKTVAMAGIGAPRLTKAAKEKACYAKAWECVKAFVQEVDRDKYDSVFLLDADVFEDTLYRSDEFKQFVLRCKSRSDIASRELRPDLKNNTRALFQMNFDRVGVLDLFFSPSLG